MSSIYDWLSWVYDSTTTADEIRASWDALQRANLNNPPYRKAMAMNKSRNLLPLKPQTLDEIMNAIRGDNPDHAALLALARGIASHIEHDETNGGETRRSFRIDGTIFIMRATDHGLPGALWKLCDWLLEHRPPIIEPPVDDEYDTRPLTPGGNEESE